MFTIVPFVFGINGWEWVIIAGIVLLLFGAAKIPALMRSLGRGVKEFKQGINEATAELEDIKKDLDSDDKNGKK